MAATDLDFVVGRTGGVTFPVGRHTSVGFFCDHTFDGSPRAALRVVLWSDTADVRTIAVGNDGGFPVVVRFAAAARTHTVTVTRTDGRAFPVYATLDPVPDTPGQIPASQVDFSGAGSWSSGPAACVGYIDRALDLAGISDPPARAAWELGMTTIASRESAYNSPQWQINTSDSNAIGPPVPNDSAFPGAPFQCSRGVAQCIPQTFARYHQAGTSLQIYDPVANFAAAMNYVMDAYGVARDGHDLAAKVQQADPNRPPAGY
ncbi:hypothetical protein [Kitasatospora sp. NPDC088346]|uniref:hypothetical protein n=1 Tax=Kitasatospora sp. NPDC088346 TaxID=3364073 RepID=UPI0037F8056F